MEHAVFSYLHARENPMKKDVYNLVTVKDGKSDTAAITAVFSEMAAGRVKCDLKLLNYFDEVPVCYPSVITAVEKDSIELAVHEHQALVIKNDVQMEVMCVARSRTSHARSSRSGGH
jgi:hypothetical protein